METVSIRLGQVFDKIEIWNRREKNDPFQMSPGNENNRKQENLS